MKNPTSIQSTPRDLLTLDAPNSGLSHPGFDGFDLGSCSLEERARINSVVRALARRRSLDSLAHFVRQAWSVLEVGTPLVWNWHLDVICAHLEAVTEGHIRRLLINIPPGHMKSLIVSVFWPAWMWLHHPEWRLLSASYSLNLAKRDAGRCKDLIESDWYQNTFKPQWNIRRDSKAQGFYQNTQRGMRKAVSVGSETTGFRANVVLVDDPLNALDAYSAVIREKAITWLDQAASTRLANPAEGAIVMIMQRLHHEDPSGHVLKQLRNPYEHLCLPTYYEPERSFNTVLSTIPKYEQWGSDPRTEPRELLFPGFFTRDVVEGLEETLQPLAFAGQHQQRPTPADGNIFRKEMLCRETDGRFEFWPYPTGRIIDAHFSWDTAVKDKTHNDLTAGCLALGCADGYTYLVPVELRRMEVPAVERVVARLWAEWKQRLGSALMGVYIEEGAGSSLIQYLRQLMATKREQGTPPVGWQADEWEQIRKAPPINIFPYTPKRDKVERAMTVLPYISGRSVRLVDTSLSRVWLDTLLGFPMIGHDDAVDATVAAIGPFAGIGQGTPVIEDHLLDDVLV